VPGSIRRLYTALAVCASWGAAPGLLAQEAADYFRQNCTSCHTIGGGRLTGPDLRNVTSRKDRDWLARFITNPAGMIDAGDSYALKLTQEARGTVMPTVSGINKARAETLLDLIEAESKLEKSQFIGLQISDRPFTAADIAAGRAIFLGHQRLAKEGPPCISCHTLSGIRGLGGGRLGPDLTRVFERLEGRKNLAMWLTAPATATMQPVYKRHALAPEEILPLVALFESSVKTSEDVSPASLTFFLIGFGGAVLGLFVFDSAWKTRFRTVRRALVLDGIHRGEE
jgi:mono/diheme cytochrome c family protein